MIVSHVCTSADLVAQIAAGNSVELAPGNYTISAPLVIKSNQFLKGPAAQLATIVYTGPAGVAIRTDTASVAKYCALSGFTLEGNAVTTAGIEINGAWFSNFEDLVIRNCTTGIGMYVKGYLNFGTYYSTFKSISASGDLEGVKPNLIGFKLETTDFATQPARVNSNVMTLCTANFNTEYGLYGKATSGLTMIGCNFEKNRNSGNTIGRGVYLKDCSSTFITGGNFENHPTADIEVDTGTVRTTIVRVHMASTNRLIGAGLGATGDFYQVAESTTAPGPLVYDGNWMQKAHISDLSAGYLELAKLGAGFRTIYIKQPGDTNYRFQEWSDGVMEWGPGNAAVDTKLSRTEANTLSMESGGDFRVAGGWNTGRFRLGNYRLWVDAAGKLRIKNGAPTLDTDGTVVGTQV